MGRRCTLEITDRGGSSAISKTPQGPLVQMGITRVAKVFAILSALLNVGLVFYITQHWVPNDAASVGGAMIKTNGGKHFSFEVYDENDIVSDAVKQDGWERNVVASLNEYFQDYS